MSKTSKTGGTGSGGNKPQTTTSQSEKAADTAKDKVVKPDTEKAIKDAAAAVTGTAKHASGVAKDQAENAKKTAEEAIHTARDEAKVQGENIKQQAKSRYEGAKAQAHDMSEDAKQRAHDEAESRKKQATGQMGTTAQDLRKASEAVEESWMSKAFANAAGQIEDVTRSIENKSPEELVDVARKTAREHPGFFLAGCFAAGVAISRTLKVAASRQPEHYYDDQGQRRTVGASTTPRALGTSGGTARTGSELPNVGGHETPDGQVGIGTGSGVTDGLGSDSSNNR